MNYQTLFIIAWKSRYFLLKICGIGLLSGLIVTYSIPNEYETSIFTVPESTSTTISGEESLDFEALSLDMGSGQKIQDAILPSFYPLIISSTSFLVSLFDTPVTPVVGKETQPMTLYEYISEHQRSPWWNTIKALPFRVIALVGSLFTEDKNPDKFPTTDKQTDPSRLTQEEIAVAGAISQRIIVGVDKTKRTITLTVRMQDPVVATIVADSVKSHLQAHITEYRTRKERENFVYTEELYQQAQESYYTAQKTYASYADSNRDLSGAGAQSELIRLRADMNIAYRDYVKMTQQLQQAKTRLEKQRPVYTIIEPAKVPLRPVAPRKGRILIGFIILSGAAGYGWILLKNKIKATQ